MHVLLAKVRAIKAPKSVFIALGGVHNDFGHFEEELGCVVEGFVVLDGRCVVGEVVGGNRDGYARVGIWTP